jgi:hypothetical protein
MRPTDLKVGERCLKVAVSGSFHRHMAKINEAVQQLASLSIRVLSPADPRIVAQQGEFLFVASDRIRSVRLVQDRHLDSIRAADFLWLVCPDGYVGPSASMEVGYAAAAGVLIFGTHAPSDLTLREYVILVPKLSEAVRRAEASARPRRPEGILIDPRASIEEAHDTLGRIEIALTRQKSLDDPACRVHRDIADLQAKLRLTSYMQ